MSRPPTLLLWSPLPPPTGGIATWTQRLLASTLSDRYDVHIVNTAIGGLGNDDRLGRVKLMMQTLPRWARALQRHRPDVVHVNTSARWPGFIKDALAVRMARAAGARTVLHIRGRGLHFLWEHPRWTPAHRRMLGWADQVLVLNAAAVEHAQQCGIHHVRQVPGMVIQADPPQRTWSPPDQPLRLVYVGHMLQAKGIFELLEAVAAVPDVDLTAVGRWVVEQGGQSNQARFEAEVQRLGIADRVRAVGGVSLEEVWDHYGAADAFVLPSWSEGCPNSLLEAMMAGLPAVVTTAGAMPELVLDGETGRVVPIRDVAALTQAIADLASDRDRVQAWGAASRERVMTHNEREQVVGLLADLYDELTGLKTRVEEA